MGLFDKIFKKGASAPAVLYAPVRGTCVPVTEVSGPTFSQEILGKGGYPACRGQGGSPLRRHHRHHI